MTDKGLMARSVLSSMFKVSEGDIVFMKHRHKNKVKARRFYNYYLWKYKKIRHNSMKNFIHGIHHASSIYQCRIMEKDIDLYKDIRKEFITFLWYSDKQEFEKMKIDMVFSNEEMNDIDYKKAYIDAIIN